MLDYFEVCKATVILPQKRTAGSGTTKREAVEKSAVVRERSGVYGKTGSPKKGEFMDVKSDGEKFKGLTKAPDKRRK